MAVITPTPIILNDIVLTIGADNFEASVSKVLLTPTVPKAVWKGMTPTAVYPVAGAPTWVCTVDYPQDFAALTSLSEYLRANVGTTKTVVFKPKKPASGTAPTYTIDLVIQPGPIGGEVNTIPTGSVEMDCLGQPVRTVA